MVHVQDHMYISIDIPVNPSILIILVFTQTEMFWFISTSKLTRTLRKDLLNSLTLNKSEDTQKSYNVMQGGL